jgi:hypothetical protein
MEKYHIEYIGGCHHCQPNADWAEDWGIIPDEIYDLLTESDSCCEEIDENGRRIKNIPVFCKYEEEGSGEEDDSFLFPFSGTTGERDQ